MWTSFLASFPSPASGILKIGPISLHAYGMCIAFGMLAAVTWTSKRWVAQGGDQADVGRVATFALPAGVIGARIYHVVTDFRSFKGDWARAFKVWEGGLGVLGGVALGTVVGLLVARQRRLPLAALLDAAAPALPLAQAIGRWGNWFNQELFGRPSTLPWAVEISPTRRPDAYRVFSTFHPTFLYESIWNLLVVGLVVFVQRKFRHRLKPGRLFAVYLAGYAFGRFFIERMRTDEATEIFGQRVNVFVAAVLFLISVAIVATGVQRGGKQGDQKQGDQKQSDDQHNDENQSGENAAQPSGSLTE
jgi:prolipoprotein diacylglyceryl transferase